MPSNETSNFQYNLEGFPAPRIPKKPANPTEVERSKSKRIILIGNNIPFVESGRPVPCRRCGKDLVFDRRIKRKTKRFVTILSDIKCTGDCGFKGTKDFRYNTSETEIKEYSPLPDDD